MTKLIFGVVAVVIVACFGLPTLLLSSTMGGTPGDCSPAGTSAARPSEQPTGGGAWDGEQFAIAATVIDVGAAKGVPRWGWVIAVATAMQESRLRNLPPRGDRDSVGVFQQRPSQGWGSVEQLSKPAYQAGRFFDRLLAIPGWQTMPLTEAAQAVQRSALPDAYAAWTDDALHVVDRLASTLADCTTDAPAALPAGFTLPASTPPAVTAAVWWAVTQLGAPYHFGGTCTNPRSGDPDQQCDCSSLVQRAYAAAGIAIPRITTDQAHTGVPVTTPDALRPGDLILIPGSEGTMTSPRHVGMYLGQGLIIQAPRTGDVVKLTRVDAWLPQIAVIRRIVGPSGSP